jgi:GMP synthase (glutamine-hydrolysing)
MAEGNPRFVLLQARDPGDPMARHEQTCFANALGIPDDHITLHDLLSGAPTEAVIDHYDAILVGGSGDYSVLEDHAFLPPFFDFLAQVVIGQKVPTFASCFGFQALVLAGGGDVVHDESRAEVGTYDLTVTEAGLADPLFGSMPPTFMAQLGHKDHAARLPAGMINLASSESAPFQALRVEGLPVIATQFHPELTCATNTERYLRYWDAYGTGDRDNDPVLARMADSPDATALLSRWVEMTLGG